MNGPHVTYLNCRKQALPDLRAAVINGARNGRAMENNPLLFQTLPPMKKQHSGQKCCEESDNHTPDADAS
jgi:hypothetical protein